MTANVPGLYSHGKIELLEQPVGIRDGKVRVILIEVSETGAGSPLQYGKYGSGTLSTEDDFVIAEWRGDSDAE
jgi:hypothetical protein